METPKLKSKYKGGGGKRCAVGNCSNGTGYKGNQYTLYCIDTMKDPTIQKKWRKFIGSTRRNYDPKAKGSYVCDGHFTEDSFDLGQKIRFNSGSRSRAPGLRSDAVPSIKFATPPHFPKTDKGVQQMSRNEMEEAAKRKQLSPISLTPIGNAAPSPDILTRPGATAHRAWTVSQLPNLIVVFIMCYLAEKKKKIMTAIVFILLCICFDVGLYTFVIYNDQVDVPFTTKKEVRFNANVNNQIIVRLPPPPLIQCTIKFILGQQHGQAIHKPL